MGKISMANYAVLYKDGILEFQDNNEFNDNIVEIYTGFNTDIYKADGHVPWYKHRKNIKLVKFSNIVKPVSLAYWFAGCESLVEIKNIELLDTSNVVDMSSMFLECSSLKSIDVSHFNTKNVTDMWSMFADCYSLDSLDISNFNTGKVTDMGMMFANLDNLTLLKLGKLDTRKVTDMYSMFSACSKLTSLDVSSFDTSNVIDMEWMFLYCSKLKSLDLSSFNTSKVKSMKYMFDNLSDLVSLKLGEKWKWIGNDHRLKNGLWVNDETKTQYVSIEIPDGKGSYGFFGGV